MSMIERLANVVVLCSIITINGDVVVAQIASPYCRLPRACLPHIKQKAPGLGGHQFDSGWLIKYSGFSSLDELEHRLIICVCKPER